MTAAYNTTVNRTVLRGLADCFVYIKDHIGVGPHGIMRMQTGDWNDVFVQEAMDSGLSRAEVIATAESTTNAAMSAAVLPRFADIIELAAHDGPVDPTIAQLVPAIRQFASEQAAALRKHAWNGQWLNRAWIPVKNKTQSPGAAQFPGGWACTNGVDRRLCTGLCLEPQPWAILASHWAAGAAGQADAYVLTPTQTATLVESLQRELASPMGSTVLNKAFRRTGRAPAQVPRSRAEAGGAADAGQHENGGVWPSQNHPLILALATTNATAAEREWTANSRATQAKAFPKYWPGIWSAADVATSHLSTAGQVGTQSWPSMPVLCTHPHSWPVVSAARLSGLTFDAAGLSVRPALPTKLGSFAFETQLAGVRRNQTGAGEWEYAGHWAPAGGSGDGCTIHLDLRSLHAGEITATDTGFRVGSARWQRAEAAQWLYNGVLIVASGAPCGGGQTLGWKARVRVAE